LKAVKLADFEKTAGSRPAASMSIRYGISAMQSISLVMQSIS
jgi:hypothetical protein